MSSHDSEHARTLIEEIHPGIALTTSPTKALQRGRTELHPKPSRGMTEPIRVSPTPARDHSRRVSSGAKERAPFARLVNHRQHVGAKLCLFAA